VRAYLAAKLGIKVLPSEDLKSRRIFDRLNLAKVNEEMEQAGHVKVTFGRPYGAVPEVLFEKKGLIFALQ